MNINPLYLHCTLENRDMKNAITTENFFQATLANFTKIEDAPNRLPDFKSPSGSEYWYEGSNVIRRSNHWGAVATCSWLINGGLGLPNQTYVGICDLADFIAKPEGNDFKQIANAGMIAKAKANPRLRLVASFGINHFFAAA